MRDPVALASSPRVRLRIGRLQAHLANLTGQMRRCQISLCGVADDEANKLMDRMFKLRRRMAVTHRRITNLKYQDGARN